VPKRVLFFVIIIRGISATYPAPISTIFETAYVNRFSHAYTGEKFSNFCAGVFPRLKTADFGTVDSEVLVIELEFTGTISGDENHFRG